MTDTMDTSANTEPSVNPKAIQSVAELDMRDYFAAKALQGWFASSASTELIPAEETIEEVRASWCQNFYEWADAMLAAREKSE